MVQLATLQSQQPRWPTAHGSEAEDMGDHALSRSALITCARVANADRANRGTNNCFMACKASTEALTPCLGAHALIHSCHMLPVCVPTGRRESGVPELASWSAGVGLQVRPF